MVATLAQIRAGIAANILAGTTGLQVNAYMLSNPTAPIAMVGGPDTVDYDRTFGGAADWTVPVLLYVGLAVDVEAQKLLDGYLAQSGLKAAIESDPTLGGTVDSIRVTTCTGYRQYLMGDNTIYLGAEWTCEIYA